MKYFWKCTECGYENHGKKVYTNSAKTMSTSQFPVKCPMCDKKTFVVVERD